MFDAEFLYDFTCHVCRCRILAVEPPRLIPLKTTKDAPVFPEPVPLCSKCQYDLPDLKEIVCV